jgi:hypothetical protein
VSKLVAWEPKEHFHLFKDRETMRNVLGVPKITLAQWIVKKKISPIHLDVLGGLARNKKHIDKFYKPRNKIKSEVQAKRLTKNEKAREKQKRQMTKLILNGGTIESIAKRLKILEDSVLGALYRYYHTTSIELIRNSLTTNK